MFSSWSMWGKKEAETDTFWSSTETNIVLLIKKMLNQIIWLLNVVHSLSVPGISLVWTEWSSNTSAAISLPHSLTPSYSSARLTLTNAQAAPAGPWEAGRGGMDWGKLDLIDKCLRIALLLALRLRVRRLHSQVQACAETLSSRMFFKGYHSDSSSQ